jgi:hypothetical protein
MRSRQTSQGLEVLLLEHAALLLLLAGEVMPPFLK